MMSSLGGGQFNSDIDVCGAARVVGPLTVGTNVSQLAGQESLIVKGNADITGDLNVQGKISSTTQRDDLHIDRLHVAREAVFTGTLAPDVFDIPAGRKYVFRVGGQTVATLGVEGLKLFNVGCECGDDMLAVLDAIVRRGYPQAKMLYEKVTELMRAMEHELPTVLHRVVKEISAMLLELRCHEPQLAAKLEMHISELLDMVPALPPPMAHVQPPPPPQQQQQDVPPVQASMPDEVREELNRLLKSGTARVGEIEAAFQTLMAELKQAACDDISLLRGTMDATIADCKTKSLSALNGLLLVSRTFFDTEKMSAVQHLDTLQSLLNERVDKLGTVLHATFAKLASSNRADIEEGRSRLAKRGVSSMVLCDLGMASMDNLAVSQDLIDQRIRLLHDAVIMHTAKAKAAVGQGIDGATDTLAKVKAGTLDRKMYSFDAAANELSSSLDGVGARVVTGASLIIDEAFCLMCNSIN